VGALSVKLIESLMECQERVGGRSETELTVALQSSPLCIEVETQRARIAFGLFQPAVARQDKAESRNAFDAFVCRRDQEVDMVGRKIYGDRAKAAHRVHNITCSCSMNHFPDFFDRVEDSGRCLAMDHRNMGDTGRCGKPPGNDGRRVFLVLGDFDGLSKREDNRQSRNILEGIRQGLKPTVFLEVFSARLKSCPDTKQAIVGGCPQLGNNRDRNHSEFRLADNTDTSEKPAKEMAHCSRA
jgi:hypothetical protein